MHIILRLHIFLRSARICEISGWLPPFFGICSLFLWYLVALEVGNNNERRVPSSWCEWHVEIDWSKRWESSELCETKNHQLTGRMTLVQIYQWGTEFLFIFFFVARLVQHHYFQSLSLSLSLFLSLLRDTRLVPSKARHTNREAARDTTRVKINELL